MVIAFVYKIYLLTDSYDIMYYVSRWEVGWGVLNKCSNGEAPPRGPTPYLLYTIFHE